MFKQKLYVEGSDEKHFMGHLFRSVQIPYFFDDPKKNSQPSENNSIQIKPCEGDQNLLGKLIGFVRESELDHIGFILDADQAPRNRWISIRDKLKKVGFDTLPDEVPSGGVILSPPDDIDAKKLGIWLMPNNRESGQLEDFIKELISPEDDLWEIACQTVAKLPQPHRFLPQKRIKAEIHSWLAWQKEPGTALGQAVTKKYLDSNSPMAQQFLRWARELFDIEVRSHD